MSAIYQRARPIHWDEVVGQEHVKDVLRAALERGRVGHAYLFSGPRGVGKTTTARLIAMTANCEVDGVKPCGKCPSCMMVRAGSHPDVMEIDAASNNSVDDVRELREKVSLSAMRGGKKIYILDEAHMMSRAAFNALLKTLEEPPSHVIFVLATTEPEKILPTILSRCQHYRFRRLTDAEIAGKLAGLCEQEGVQAEPEALALIGRLADGAMRDGESLLERMLATGEAITRGGVELALGLPPSERLSSMTRALVGGDAEALLEGAGVLYREGYAARTVVSGLVSALRDALHAQLGLGQGERIDGAQVPRLLRLQAALDEQESRFARGADLMSLELALTHALIAADGPVAAAGAAQTASAGVSSDVAGRLARLEREVSALRAAPPARRTPAASAPDDIPDFDPAVRRAPAPRTTPADDDTAEPAAAPTGGRAQGSWQDVMRQADVKLRAFLKPARVSTEGGVTLTFDDRSKFHAKQVLDKFDDLAAIVTRVFGDVPFEIVSSEGTKKKSARDGTARVSGPAAAVVREAAAKVREAAPAAVTAPAASEVAVATPARAAARAAVTHAPDDIPDFEPTRRASPAAAPTPAPAPSPVPVDADVYDPEPVMQEPVWDDVPLDAPQAGGPPETSWEQLGSAAPPARAVTPAGPDDASRPASRRSSASPEVTPRQAVAGAAAGVMREHPVFQEATRLFGGRVRDAGTLRRKPGGPETDAAEEDDAESV